VPETFLLRPRIHSSSAQRLLARPGGAPDRARFQRDGAPHPGLSAGYQSGYIPGIFNGGAKMAAESPTRRQAVEYFRQGIDTFQTTRVDSVVNWARKYSMFLYPFVTACCGMEFMSVAGPRYDLDRFGCALPRFSPRQSDLLMVVGTITHRQAPILKKVYDQMAEPKWVLAFGACVCSGGPYNNYATVQGIDTIIPVDIYIPGCPPRPEAVLDGLMKLQDRVQIEKVPSTGRHKEISELSLPVLEKPYA
jgi:NADH-quinone oxidoreductase subunit B